MAEQRREKYLHLVFVWGLVFKGVFAAAEIVAGIESFLVSQAAIIRVARALTREELSEDPSDVVANYLVRAAEHFSGSAAHFVGVYLASHGAVKLGLIVALLMKKLWAYPIAIAVFGGFVAYQAYRYSTTHAASLILLTAVDVVVVVLTWREYRYMRRGGRAKSAPDERPLLAGQRPAVCDLLRTLGMARFLFSAGRGWQCQLGRSPDLPADCWCSNA